MGIWVKLSKNEMNKNKGQRSRRWTAASIVGHRCDPVAFIELCVKPPCRRATDGRALLRARAGGAPAVR